MNKKGFTVVELIVSFSLTAVITIFLVQIVMALNNIYNSSGIKTELLTKQSLISSQINKKFSDKKISSVTSCGNYCLKFNYSDKTSDTFKIDYSNNTLEFGNYKTDLPEDTYFKDVKVDIVYGATIQNNINNAILNIVIPIYNDKLKDEDFGVNIAYQFNTDNSNIEYVDFAGKGEYIVLNGDTEQTFNTQTAYVEQGYTIYDKNGNVIDGNVEVDNPLTTIPYKAGNYKIKYSLKDNNNNIISQTTRSVIVTPSTYEITNLITNGSFEEGLNGWYNYEYTNYEIATVDEGGYYGNSSLRFNYNTEIPSYTSMTVQNISVPILNHKYYGALMFKSSSTFTTNDCRFEWYYNDSEGGKIIFTYKDKKTIDWIKLSGIYSLVNSDYLDKQWVVRNFQVNPQEYSYVDGLIIIDLTETFGAGNEPSQEWCDENINWFEGTTKINY